MSYFYAPNEAQIRYSCGHKDRHAVIIKVPERLQSACQAKGWLHNVNSWNSVVAFHHPRARNCGVTAIGFASERCSECVLTELNDDLAVVDREPVKSAVRASSGSRL